MCGMDDEVRITLRLSGDLHAWLVAVAKTQRRSLNSEIVYRLEAARINAESCGSATNDPLRGKSSSSPP